MALDKEDIKQRFPLPAYNYRVTIMVDGEAIVAGFSEVSGLSIDYEPVTYKHGLSFITGTTIVPGMKQPVSITLTRGVTANYDFLYSWLHNTYLPLSFESRKRDILIDLCDEAGAPMIRWKVTGALPRKLDAPTFDANTSEAAIESLELVAHGVQVDYDL